MNRKLHQCPTCNEWFNTTEEVMREHKFRHTQSFTMGEICRIFDVPFSIFGRPVVVMTEEEAKFIDYREIKFGCPLL